MFNGLWVMTQLLAVCIGILIGLRVAELHRQEEQRRAIARFNRQHPSIEEQMRKDGWTL